MCCDTDIEIRSIRNIHPFLYRINSIHLLHFYVLTTLLRDHTIHGNSIEAIFGKLTFTIAIKA